MCSLGSLRRALLRVLPALLLAAPAAAQTSPSSATTAAAATPATTPEVRLPNRMCPVMTWQFAVPEHHVVARGKDVFFCCADCRAEFLKDPAPYLPNLPQFEGANTREVAAAILAEQQGAVKSGPIWGVVGALVALGLAVALTYRVVRRERATQDTDPGAGPSPAALKLTITALIGILIPTAVALYQVSTELATRKLVDVLHFATFHDFGFPPRPVHPPFPPRLEGTYWRGNDERAAKLFNGGNYLTSTFHTSIRTGAGEPIDHGDAAGGERLSVRLEIERAPNTPDFFFSEEIMGAIFLSRKAGYFVGSAEEPATDAVGLREIEDGQRWEALYPLGEVPAQGRHRMRGVVYVFERLVVEGETIGSRYHYGLAYDLRTVDGVVQPESDLWMGFLYRTRKTGVNKIPYNEWFSIEPIPPIPEGLQITDPALLGITDREEYGES